MAAKYILGNLKFPQDFEDAKWVDGQEVIKYDCITGIREDLVQTMEIFEKF